MGGWFMHTRSSGKVCERTQHLHNALMYGERRSLLKAIPGGGSCKPAKRILLELGKHRDQ